MRLATTGGRNPRTNNPPKQLVEVVAGDAHDRIDPVAFSTDQIVAIQAVIAFQVSDRQLACRAPF